MNHHVVWSARQLGGTFIQSAPMANTTDSREGALVLAEVLASEHAERIGVPFDAWYKLGQLTGFYLRTNNGTDVWYTVYRQNEMIERIRKEVGYEG